VRARSRRKAFLSTLPIFVVHVKGFKTATPVRSWRGTLRVTTVRPYISAVAAICLSSGFYACGTRSLRQPLLHSPS
jgi:hypothetical protein